MSGIKMIGLNELQRKLKANCNLSDVRRVVQVNGDELNKKMKRKTTTAFTKGYTTGDTANSINTEIRDDGMTAAVGPTTDYSPYVEYGTRFMQAEPFIRPSWEEQKELFKKDMDKLVK